MDANLFAIVLGSILVLWGLANVLFGYRFYRISLLVSIGILAAGYSFILLRESPNIVQILVPGLVALLFGLAAYYLRSLILILAGGIIMAIVAATPAVIFSLSETLAWILIISGFIAGCGLAYFFRDFAIYLVTAMWGTSFTFSGLTIIFLGTTFSAFQALGSGTWLVLSAWILLVAGGIFWQHRGQAALDIEPDQVSKANQLRIWQAALVSLALGLGVAGFLGMMRIYSPFATLTPPDINDFEPLSVDGYERLLVLAPHNDDEALGAAGLIMQAAAQGAEVKVVFLTNGDGFTFSTIQEFDNIFPSAEDYIGLGALRQQESINVLGLLGVPEENIIFLGYPDAGAPAMWTEHWSADNPYQSEFTQSSRSPYEDTFNPDSVYAGEDVLGDLREIIDEFQPDIVAYPHGNDVHADHWGFYAFSRLAIEIEQYLNPDFTPDAFVYLVHRPDYPSPEGYDPTEKLLPPAPIFNIYPDWYRLDMTPDQVALKETALEAYESQVDLLWALISKFIRKNEVFSTNITLPIQDIAQGEEINPDTWRDALGQNIPPIQLDPTADILERALIPSADIKSLYLARSAPDKVVGCIETVSGADPTVFNILHLKGIGFGGIIDHVQDAEPSYTTDLDFLDRKYYACSTFSLAEMGDPVFIFAGAESKDFSSDQPLDHIAWQMVEIP